MAFLELNSENLHMFDELSSDRWGDSSVLDDIQNGSFKVITIKKESDTSSITSDSEISRASCTSSQENWTQVGKKIKKNASSDKFSHGKIKVWNSEKGFGYVTFENSNENIDNITQKTIKKRDTYIHISEIPESERKFMKKGQKIKFNISYDTFRDNTYARNVKVLKKV